MSRVDIVYKCVSMLNRYFFQHISKFLEDSVDIFYGTKGLKSIDYSKTVDFRP